MKKSHGKVDIGACSVIGRSHASGYEQGRECDDELAEFSISKRGGYLM